jgi:hypothetical protein
MDPSQTLSERDISTVLSGPNPNTPINKWKHAHTSEPTDMESLGYQVCKQSFLIYTA